MHNKIKLIASFLLTVYITLSVSLNFIHSHPLILKTEYQSVVQDDSGLCAVCHFGHHQLVQDSNTSTIEFSFDYIKAETGYTFISSPTIQHFSNRAPPSLV